MSNFRIIIDSSLIEKMAQYNIDWSEVCRQAIENKINSLGNNNPNTLIDIDLSNVSDVKKDNIPEFPREIYQLFKKVWKEYFSLSNYPKSKIPTSTEIKQLWKTWYSTVDNDDDYDWYEKWEDYEREELEESIRTNIGHFTTDQNEFLLDFYYEMEDHTHEPIYTQFVQFVSRFIWDGQLLKIYDLNPLYLKSVTMENKDNLPESSGIYFVVDESKIYYIGMSVNLNKRWYDHHKQEQLDSIPNLKISYIDSLPKHYLKNIESTLIKHFVPYLNIKENPLCRKV